MSHRRTMSGLGIHDERLQLWQYECDMVTGRQLRELDLRESRKQELTVGDRRAVAHACNMVAHCAATTLDVTEEMDTIGRLLHVIQKMTGVDPRDIGQALAPVSERQRELQHQRTMRELLGGRPSQENEHIQEDWRPISEAPRDGTVILLKTNDGVISGSWLVERPTPGEDDGFAVWDVYGGDYMLNDEDILAWQLVPAGTNLTTR